MDSNIFYFIAGIFVAYFLFLLDELYTYFRQRRQQKLSGKEIIK